MSETKCNHSAEFMAEAATYDCPTCTVHERNRFAMALLLVTGVYRAGHLDAEIVANAVQDALIALDEEMLNRANQELLLKKLKRMLP